MGSAEWISASLGYSRTVGSLFFYVFKKEFYIHFTSLYVNYRIWVLR
nr:MAG TPA_asm: hypothetical protein [Caudoviricetes sp.]